LTAGTRRNGSSKVGLFKRSSQDGGQAGRHHGAGGSADQYTGRHAAAPRSKTARKRAGKVVPATGVAAALVAGAAAYGLVAGTGHPQSTQLSTDLALPVSLSSANHAGIGVGGVDSAASAMIAAARTASSAVASASAKQSASRSAKAVKPTVAPSSAAASTAAPQTASTEAAATPSATATPTSPDTQSSSGGSAAVETDIATGLYLLDNGYSAAAAAGVASCVDGESGANPESEGSGGGGLIGWTPLGSAEPDANIVTGDVSVDMMTQLADILYYNSNEIGQSRVDELNSQTDPVAAADFYSQNFEKPAVTDSDVVPSVAEEVYSELGG